MNSALQRIKNRLLYLYSPGSPLRYARKAVIYALNLPEFTKRKPFARAQVSPKLVPSLAELRANAFANVSGKLDEQLQLELLAAAKEKMEKDPDGRSVVARNYVTSMLQSDDLRSDSIWVRYATQPEVLKFVAHYFGHAPALCQVEFFISKPTVNSQWAESQLWHRDYDDSQVLKLFVYLNDVKKDGDGPFTFLPPKESAEVKTSFIPKRVTDEQMTGLGMEPSFRRVYGNQGTIFFIDTGRAYHMGSRCVDQERLAYSATYTSMAPLYSHRNGIQITGELGELAALALKE